MGIDKENISPTPTFRAFDVRSYEDQEELRYDFTFLQPIMARIENELEVPFLSRISRIQQRTMITGCEFENYVDFNEEKNYVPYVLCFSNISNNDYLWNNVSREGRVCIHVEESYLKKTGKNYIYWGDKVMYGPNTKQIRSELLEWYKTYHNYFVPTNLLNEINRNEHIAMSAIRYCIYPFIKLDKEPYTLEDEYRVVCLVTNKEFIKYTENQRAYFELKLPKASICRIDFSQSTSDQKIHDIRDKLMVSGYTAKKEGRCIIL